MGVQPKGNEAQFVERFKASRSLRAQMALILFGVCLSGPLFSKVMLLAGVHGMAVRYPLAVGAAYLTFFLLVKAWLTLVLPAGTPGRGEGSSPGPGDGSVSLGDGLPDLAGSGDASPFRGGGGRFDGAGAAVALDGAGGGMRGSAGAGGISKTGKGTSGPSGSWDLDKEVVVLLLLVALLAVIFGAAILLVWQAPVILSEAALQAALASGLVRRTHQGAAGHWTGGVFRATWKPFAWVLALALVLGLTATALFPGAEKLSDILRSL
ncbi:MAG: hypothetical protein KA419_11710 [Acidobacteria bacterium]|nr:hypothetical protein [Acidobacteriota bacterium]